MKCDLQDAIEKLYKAFADVPKPKAIAGCPCCIEDENIDILLTKPLKKISSKDIGNYAFCLFNTVGDEADFQYFLPRIWELMLEDINFCADPEISLKKLTYVRWQE